MDRRPRVLVTGSARSYSARQFKAFGVASKLRSGINDPTKEIRERVRGNHLVEVTNASFLRRERCAQPPVFVSRLRVPSFSSGGP